MDFGQVSGGFPSTLLSLSAINVHANEANGFRTIVAVFGLVFSSQLMLSSALMIPAPPLMLKIRYLRNRMHPCHILLTSLLWTAGLL